MVLSRFWYIVTGFAVGAALFVLFLATRMYDRASVRSMGEALAGDSQVVASYLRDDARRRATTLIPAALDDDIRAHLAKASAAPDKIPADSKDKVRTALRRQFNNVPAEQKFDAMFAVDPSGRVVAQVGFDQASAIDNFELGGYPVVADALHGWVRDDTWVLGSRIFRVVARPVEHDVAQMPAGAVVGLRVLDDGFARELSRRTGAAIGFFASGARISSGAPEGFDTAQLDTITSDLKGVDADPMYREKGFTDVRVLHEDLGVVYARLVGEAWDVGAGYAVARTVHLVGSPLEFLTMADDKDKHSVPLAIIVLVALGAAGVGLAFSYLEHSRPLRGFLRAAEEFGKSGGNQLMPSRFWGAYRQIASHLGEGIERSLAKGGAPRRAADLDAVLGPMPAQPSMSAFSVPLDSQSAERPAAAPFGAPAAPFGSPARASPAGQKLGMPPAAPKAAAPVAPAMAGPAIVPPPVPKPPVRPPAAKPPSSARSGVTPVLLEGRGEAESSDDLHRSYLTPAETPVLPRHSSPTAAGAPVLVAPAPLAGAARPDGAELESRVAPEPLPKPIPAAGRPSTIPGPVAQPARVEVALRRGADEEEEEEETVVSQVPSEILGQLAADRDTGRPPALDDEAADWRRVYEEFVRLKKACDEPTEGISFEKFRNTLRKNRDQLLLRHSCKAVKFSVYVKEGKAALKASPVRD